MASLDRVPSPSNSEDWRSSIACLSRRAAKFTTMSALSGCDVAVCVRATPTPEGHRHLNDIGTEAESTLVSDAHSLTSAGQAASFHRRGPFAVPERGPTSIELGGQALVGCVTRSRSGEVHHDVRPFKLQRRPRHQSHLDDGTASTTERHRRPRECDTETASTAARLRHSKRIRRPTKKINDSSLPRTCRSSYMWRHR